MRIRDGHHALAFLIVAALTLFHPGIDQAAQDPPTTDRMDLERLWRIGDNDDDPNEIFGVIVDLCVDDDSFVYVVDRQLERVSLFDPNGHWVRAIGREGDGPEEFRRPWQVFSPASREVCVIFGNGLNILRYSRSGEYIDTLHRPRSDDGIATILQSVKRGGGRLYGMVLERNVSRVIRAGTQTETRSIRSLDQDFHTQITFYSERRHFDESHPVWNERPRALAGRWIVDRNGNVYVASAFIDYEVTSYDPAGNVRYVARPDYKPRKRSSEEKQAVYDWATINPNGNLPGTSFDIEDYDKSVMALSRVRDGKLWLLSSRGVFDRPEGSIGVFDVLSRDGKLERRVALMGDGDPIDDRFYFAGDRLYVVSCYRAAIAGMVASDKGDKYAESCDGNMTITCYRIPE